MYKCSECENRFEEPKQKQICFETEYGVSNLFDSRTFTTVSVCPYCEDSGIEELVKCDVCEEWFEEDELEDTTEYINGGVGYACEQCRIDGEMIEI